MLTRTLALFCVALLASSVANGVELLGQGWFKVQDNFSIGDQLLTFYVQTASVRVDGKQVSVTYTSDWSPGQKTSNGEIVRQTTDASLECGANRMVRHLLKLYYRDGRIENREYANEPVVLDHPGGAKAIYDLLCSTHAPSALALRLNGENSRSASSARGNEEGDNSSSIAKRGGSVTTSEVNGMVCVGDFCGYGK